MRLAQKLTVALLLIFVIFTVVRSAFDTQRAVAHYVDGIRIAHRDLGATLSTAVVKIWEAEGWERALSFLAAVERTQIDTKIRWVWLGGDTRPEYRPVVPLAVLLPRVHGDHEIIIDPSDRDKTIVSYKPVALRGLPPGALEFTRSTEQEEAFLREERDIQIATSAGLVLLFMVVATGLGRLWVGEPIAALMAHARRVAAGDFSSPLSPIVQRDEIGTLAGEMNDMSRRLDSTRRRAEREHAARLEVQAQLRHADRLATVGRLSASLIHEVGTPLNVISGRAKMIADGEVEGADAVANALRIHEQATRIAAMMRGLLDHARKQDEGREHANLRDLIDDATVLLGPLARTARVALLADGDAVGVSVHRGQIRQVLINLVTNAIQAMPSGGEVKLSVGVRSATHPEATDAAAWAVVEVRDAGVGMEPAALERVFEPFYTTKREGEGTGLGLNVTQTIVADHGGWMSVDSELGVGSTFTVYLPNDGGAT